MPVIALTAQDRQDTSAMAGASGDYQQPDVSMDSSVDVKTDAADDNMSYVSRPSDVSTLGEMDSTTRGSLCSSSFLDNDKCRRLLALPVNGLTFMPDGVKENMYFITKNSDNLDQCTPLHGYEMQCFQR